MWKEKKARNMFEDHDRRSRENCASALPTVEALNVECLLQLLLIQDRSFRNMSCTCCCISSRLP
jgi:hypothetical protein